MNLSTIQLKRTERGILGFDFGAGYDECRGHLQELQQLGYSESPATLPADRMVILSRQDGDQADLVDMVALNFDRDGNLGMVSVFAGPVAASTLAQAKVDAKMLRDNLLVAMGDAPDFLLEDIDHWDRLSGFDHPFGHAPFNACWMNRGSKAQTPRDVDELIERADAMDVPMAHAYITARPIKGGGHAAALVLRVWS